LKEGSASERDILELGWCYLQNEEAGKGVQLLEGRTVGSGEEGEYHNLLSKCCFVERRYQDAAAEARRCISCIREEAAAREEEAAEEERGKETAKIPGRIAGACDIIAKSFHVLARESGDRKEK